jgi:hypothetical protein
MHALFPLGIGLETLRLICLCLRRHLKWHAVEILSSIIYSRHGTKQQLIKKSNPSYSCNWKPDLSVKLKLLTTKFSPSDGRSKDDPRTCALIRSCTAVVKRHVGSRASICHYRNDINWGFPLGNAIHTVETRTEHEHKMTQIPYTPLQIFTE